MSDSYAKISKVQSRVEDQADDLNRDAKGEKRRKFEKRALRRELKKQNWEKHVEDVKRCFSRVVWGSDPNDYNYMRNTIFDWCSKRGFVYMQSIRLFCLLIMLVVLFLFSYIYGQFASTQFVFWMLMVTTLAFFFLLMGGGKQIVYQELLKLRKIKQNRKGRSIMWQFGVFFYGQAFPACMVANMLYFIDLRRIRHLEYYIQNITLMNIWQFFKHEMPLKNHPLSDDLEMHSTLYYYEQVGGFDWRQYATMAAHLVPAGLLCLEMLINKIRIPFKQILFHYLFIQTWILITYRYQYIFHVPVYIDNMNWFCRHNLHYLYRDHEHLSAKVLRTDLQGICRDEELPKNTKCLPYTTTYYCGDKDLEENKILRERYPDIKPYSHWFNCMFFVSEMFLLSMIAYSLSWLLHFVKLGSAKPFKDKHPYLYLQKDTKDVPKPEVQVSQVTQTSKDRSKELKDILLGKPKEKDEMEDYK